MTGRARPTAIQDLSEWKYHWVPVFFGSESHPGADKSVHNQPKSAVLVEAAPSPLCISRGRAPNPEAEKESDGGVASTTSRASLEHHLDDGKVVVENRVAQHLLDMLIELLELR